MVGEVNLNLGYRLVPGTLSYLFGGYTFLLWEGAIRSGDQIDTVVNTTPGSVTDTTGHSLQVRCVFGHRA